jgi:chromosome segregation ATPase
MTKSKQPNKNQKGIDIMGVIQNCQTTDEKIQYMGTLVEKIFATQQLILESVEGRFIALDRKIDEVNKALTARIDDISSAVKRNGRAIEKNGEAIKANRKAIDRNRLAIDDINKTLIVTQAKVDCNGIGIRRVESRLEIYDIRLEAHDKILKTIAPDTFQ